MDQVQMDTTEYTATEKETIQVDQDIGDNLIVEDQLTQTSVIFLDSPNGDLEGTSNNPTQHSKSKTRKHKQNHPRPKLSEAKPLQLQQLYTQQRVTLQAERQVYMLLPPCLPTRERTQIVVPLMCKLINSQTNCWK